MVPISGTAIAAIVGAIGQAIGGLAQSTGLDFVVQRLVTFWRQCATQQQLQQAIKRGSRYTCKNLPEYSRMLLPSLKSRY